MYWFWLNMPLAAVFFSAWVGIPLWLVFRHQHPGAAPVAVQAPACPAEPAELPVTAAPQRTGELAGV